MAVIVMAQQYFKGFLCELISNWGVVGGLEGELTFWWEGRADDLVVKRGLKKKIRSSWKIMKTYTAIGNILQTP